MFQIDWFFWIKFGFQHILDFNGYDHMLFLLVMFTPLELKNWRTLLLWVTAFTVGHSLTLALCVFDVFTIPSSLIESAIALTILWGASRSIFFVYNQLEMAKLKRNFGTIAFFGLIHGMGFSNQLKQVSIHPENLMWELLGFNIGLELGQILFLSVLFALKYWSSTSIVGKIQLAHHLKYQFELGILVIAWLCGLWMSIDRIVNSSLN